MTMDNLVNLLVTVTLIEMMVAIGLGVALADLIDVASNWRLVTCAVLANYICIPAATVGLLFLFDAHPMIAVGFLILAVCPGAPYGPPFAAIAKGNVPVAVGLMAILAGSSALIAPILLRLLAPMLAGNEPLQIDSTKIAGTLVATQLLPLSIGVAVRHWWPGWAEKLQKPATLVSKVLNLVIVGLILIVQFHLLSEIGLRALIGMLALLVISWAVGWFLGGAKADIRRAMTLTTALRNVGVGLVIATGSFAGTPVVTATLIYGLFGVIGSLLLAVALGRYTIPMNRNAEIQTPEVTPVATSAELK